MNVLTTTLWSTFLQTCAHLKTPFKIFDHTTLNEKQQINASAQLLAGEMPSLKYYAIGNGGHRYVAGKNGFPLISPIQHLADHAALYNQLPFVLRAMDNDLSADERNAYAMRSIFPWEGRNYYAYWLKRLDLSGVVPGLKSTIVEDGVSNTTEYIPTTACLNPVAPDISNTTAVTTSGEYLSSSAILSIPFTERDVTELLNVAKILYNDEQYAVISEFAFVTGVDRVLSIPITGGSINYLEAIAAQVATFVSAYYQMVFNTKGFDFRMEVGAVEPLLGAESIITAQRVPITVTSN